MTASLRHSQFRRAARVAILGLFALVLAAGSAPAMAQKSVRRPDLVVRSLAKPPASLAPGANFTSRLTVANVGRARSARSSARAYLSRDSRKGKGDVLLAPASRVPALKRGKAVSRSAALRVPSTTATGLWFLIACADDSRRIREKNERNNCRTAAGRTSLVQPVSAPPPPPGREPAPIAGQGYSVKFDDQFDSFNTAVWNAKDFWADEEPNSVFVSNGILNVVNDRANGYSESVSAQSGPRWGGEAIKYDFQFGYAEARMRFNGGTGSWPAFWLQSSAHASYDNSPNCPEPELNFELDIMEYQGDEPSTFYGTAHRNTGDLCGVENSSRAAIRSMGFNPSGQWHTYSVLWTATQISFYVDEVLTGSVVPFDSSDQRMFLTLTMQACGWDETNDCDASTPDQLRTEVDWVKVWQK